jgi:hypothetical protein
VCKRKKLRKEKILIVKKSPETLLDQTVYLLINSKETLQNIAQCTGLSYHWLQALKYKKIDDPGITKIEILYNFLVTNIEEKNNV